MSGSRYSLPYAYQSRLFFCDAPVAPAPVISILQHACTRLPRQGGSTDPMAERLQKFLAQAGYGSRREIENWIREGKISVNDKPAELGVSVTADDRIRIDGRLVASASRCHGRRAPWPTTSRRGS